MWKNSNGKEVTDLVQLLWRADSYKWFTQTKRALEGTEQLLTAIGRISLVTINICDFLSFYRLDVKVWEVTVQVTGRPLSKVLPCPIKGSRWWFLNFPQLRDISYSNIFIVHYPGIACTDSFFSLNTAHLWLFGYRCNQLPLIEKSPQWLSGPSSPLSVTARRLPNRIQMMFWRAAILFNYWHRWHKCTKRLKPENRKDPYK